MKFINTHIIRFCLIAIVLTIAFFFLLNRSVINGEYVFSIVLSITYGVTMFFNGLLNGKKDIYEGHYGFNYHLFTYVISYCLPWIMASIGLIDERFIAQSIQIAKYWGIGLTIHAVIYVVLRKSRAIKDFDKGEIFE